MSVLALAVRAEVAYSATFDAACSGTTGDAASLVAAIASANGVAGDDVVRLQPGCTYALTGRDNY